MELLEFKNKILNLCKVSEIKDIGEVLLNAVLENNIDFFDKYNSIIDDSKDWLQALWQYYEADREEKKQDYTPKSLCKLVSALAGECKTVYDCCGGSGALTIQMLKDHKIEDVYVEELDENVIPFLLFNLCLHGASGVVINGNVLTKEKFKIYQLRKADKYSIVAEINEENINQDFLFDCAISNPPYNIKWNAPSELEALSDGRFPVVPPASNANYAFVLNCLAKANEKVVMILPNGMASERTEYEIRRYLIDNDLIETVIVMPDKMFEVTSISTCILVLNKNKTHKGEVCFIDSRKNCIVEEREQNGQFGGASHTNRTYKKAYNVLNDENIKKILDVIKNRQNISEFSAIKTNEQISENEYMLTPSRYIEFEELEHKHRDFQKIADNINYISRMRNACKLVINETIAKGLGFDIDLYKNSKENSKQVKEQMKKIGVDVEIEDYIQFTKNKNEFVFKCNDKELFPDIFNHFLSIWKNQISLLNTMENKYLSELRDQLLPDLMKGVTHENHLSQC